MMDRLTILPERRRQTTSSPDRLITFTAKADTSINPSEIPSIPSSELKVHCRDVTNMTELAKRGTVDRWSLL